MTLGVWQPAMVLAATFEVTTVADEGAGSLRQAILDANLAAGEDTITFAIPGTGPHEIDLASPLPEVDDPVTIDASAAAIDDAPGVFVDGSAAGPGAIGLQLTGSDGSFEVLWLGIVGFSGDGIVVDGPSGAQLRGNYIGTDGATDRGNGGAGIALELADGTTIANNVISGNDGPGIDLRTNATSGTSILANRIGTNAGGTAAIGNGAEGLVVRSSNNVVGDVEFPNVISGNAGAGIRLIGPQLQGNVIERNRIGTNGGGTGAIPNDSHGILVEGVTGDDDILIGGTAPIAANTIAFNGGDGVRVTGSQGPLGVSILVNSIFDNDGLGIDLGGDGETPNDEADADSGVNHLQSTPEVTLASGTDIAGVLDTEGAANYRIDVYSNTSCDPSGSGEGQTHVGSTTDVAGFSWSIDALPVNGTFITATATNTDRGETSEFSGCFEVVNGLPAPGTWVGEKTASGGGTIPGDDAVMAAGTSAPNGPAQFTYGALDPLPNGAEGSPSAEWLFYTTAATNGTIPVPWRYTGFHGFAGVTVGLNAIVIRDGDDEISNQTLVAAGPTSCCDEPSSGFDYSGTASFTVQAGDVYGFVLTGSNGDSNASLRGELVLGTQLPTDCADAQDLYGATADGRYLILPAGGQRFSVHCADMDTTAADYLELHVERIGPAYNFSSYAAGGASPGTTVTTHFSKLRFDPATLTVDINDRTFATSAGALTHSASSGDAQPVGSMPYATAMACNNGTVDGTANVDLFGTPFKVDDIWSPVGTNSASFGGSTISGGGKVVDVSGNGFCGWRQPDPVQNPLFVWNNHPGRFILQLDYAVEAPVELAAPVVFASIARSGSTADIYARVDGATNTPLTFQVSAGDSCTGGLLGGGSVLGTANATSDAEGYVVLEGIEGIASGEFVAISVAAPAPTATSTCVRTTGDNDFWPKALGLGSGLTLTTQDVIEVPGKARWYRFPIVPDQRITVELKNLPADYDLAVFKDIAKEFEAQLLPEDSDDLHQLSAEFAPSVFSPSVFSPSVFSPSVFSPDAYAPSVFSPSVFSPSVFSPSVFSPSVFSPSVFSPSVFSPSVFSPSVFSPSVFSPSVFSPSVFSPSVFSEQEVQQAFSSAQTRSLIGVSAASGTSNERVVVNTWNNTGFVYVRVTGRGAAFDPDDLFTVSVSKSGSSCTGVTDTELAPRATRSDAGDYATVVVTDSSRLTLGSATNPASLRSKLNAFMARPEVDGVLVDVAGDARVGQLRAQVAANIGCPFAVNLLAEEIKGIVDSYRGGSDSELRYVTILGDDTVIPFFRYPDQSLLGQESGYIPPVRSDSISEASLRRDYVLSQDAYGSGVSIDIRTSAFPVPGLAVGRLVETPTEIAGMLDAYTLAGGAVTPNSALVTGYDFLEDAANAVSDELSEGTGSTVNELITPNGVSPHDPASWTADDLRAELFGSRHDVMFLAGHFSANSALAADFDTSVLTAELAASTVDLRNAIVFSAGCHSGYNLVDSEALPTSQPLDWAQAFARKQSVLIAGTGYQYGDTDFLEYSERLYRDFAAELRAGQAGTTVSVGEALANAKRIYLSETPDIRGIHEKAILEATLFGLPMFGVNMPAGRGATPGGAGAITPTPVGTGPADDLGLAVQDLSITPSTAERTLDMLVEPYDNPANTVEASWLEGPDGVITNPAEPAIPKQVVNVTSTVAGQVLRGVGFRGGSYDDASNILPLTGAPTTELRGVHAPFVSPVFYPMRLWTPNYFGALGGTGGTNLIVTPAQHVSDPANPGKSIRRAFDDLDLRLFYSGNLGSAALSDAPTIVSATSALTGGDLEFSVQVVGDPKAAIHGVWITWTDGNGTWQPLDLTQDPTDSRSWRGVLDNPPSAISYVVQAVNGVGLVAFDDNLGRYYAAAGVAGVPSPTATTLELQNVPASGAFGGTASVTAQLSAGTSPVGGKPVTISIGGSSAFGVTDSAGTVTLNVPLNTQPGPTEVAAAFAGDATHLASGDSAPFSISAPAMLLTVSGPGTVEIGTPSTVTAALTGADVPLSYRTIAFIVTGPGSTAPTLVPATTNFLGVATIPIATGAIGSYSVEARFGSVVTVGTSTLDLRDPVYGPATGSATYRVIWPFVGFFSPVDNAPTVNSVKAGSTVPVKFSLGGNRGLAILASGYPKAVKYSCTPGGSEDPVEETSSSNSGLTYDPATGRYQYNWKTDKKYKGSCYRFELKLVDGQTYSALFTFK